MCVIGHGSGVRSWPAAVKEPLSAAAAPREHVNNTSLPHVEFHLSFLFKIKILNI